MMIVIEYTEEFYKVNIRLGYVEEIYDNIGRYINGLRLDIQDELSLLSPNNIEESYQCDLNMEENMNRK